jgi:hypothetical protein
MLLKIASLAECIAKRMVAHGVLGRFSVDFLSVFENAKWTHYAIEINLRKGGTTHPFLMLQFLTDGIYDAEAAFIVCLTGSSVFISLQIMWHHLAILDLVLQT